MWAPGLLGSRRTKELKHKEVVGFSRQISFRETTLWGKNLPAVETVITMMGTKNWGHCWRNIGGGLGELF